VYISSGLASGPLYTFKFDKRKDLGMITPEWAKFPLDGVRSHRTRILLELSQGADRDELSKTFEEFDVSLLLFLRQLRSVTLETESHRRVRVRRQESGDGMVTLKITDSDDKVWNQQLLSVAYSIQMNSSEPKRESITESVIVLAFPLDRNLGPLVEDQNVHAFLPLRSYGFKVRELLSI
jgi:hypothetical protein